MQLGARVRTTEPLGYKRDGELNIGPAGLEGVVHEPAQGDPPYTFRVVVDQPDSEHHQAEIPWVMEVQVEYVNPPDPRDFGAYVED